MGIAALLTATALEGCAPAPSGAAAAEASDAFVAGVEWIAAERWAEAEAAFRGAIAADPGMPLAHYGLGQARLELKRYAEAAAAFEASREAWTCAAAASEDERRASRRRLDAQIDSLRRTQHGLDADRLERQLILHEEANGGQKPRPGQDARIRDAIDRQIAQLEKLRGRHASSPPAEISLALGTARFHAGDLAGAEREFRTATATDSTAADAHNNLAVVLMLMGRLDEAERSVKAAEQRGVAVNPQLKAELRARRAAAAR